MRMKLLATIGLGLVLAGLLAVPSASADRPEQPGREKARGPKARITWSERQIVAEVSPGGTFTTEVTFRSNRDLKDAKVVLVPPRWRSFVQLSPATFAEVKAGTRYTLLVAITVPADATRARYNGQIFLREGQRILSPGLQVRIQVPVERPVGTPTPRGTPSPTGTPAATATASPTAIGTATPTPTATATLTATATPTPAATGTPPATATPTPTPAATGTPQATATPTPTPA